MATESFAAGFDAPPRLERTTLASIAFIALLLLVFVVAHVAKAEPECVLSPQPRKIITNLIVQVRGTPWPIVGCPLGVWRSYELHRRKTVLGIVAAEDSRGTPAGGLCEGGAGCGNRRDVNGVSIHIQSCFVQD